MIRVIADAIARPQATVTSYYGVLRKGGLISTTGRGRSAQHLSTLDAARILIVMLSADSLQEGEAITKLVGQLRCCRVRPGDGTSGPGATFETALAHLIFVRADQFRSNYRLDNALLTKIDKSDLQVRVTATHLRAEIRVGVETTEFFDQSGVAPPESHPDDWESMSVEDRLIRRAKMEGMAVTRTVDNHVISKVAAAMP